MDADRVNRWLTMVAILGVLIGLFLLVFEIRQNTDLMRAQIAMQRTISTREIYSDWANGGELIPIEVKLFEQLEDFPLAVGWSSLLVQHQ